MLACVAAQTSKSRLGIRARQRGGMSRRRQLQRESTVDEKAVEALVQRHIQRRADPTHFTDGSFLEKLAVEHCEAFRKLFHGKRNVPPLAKYRSGLRALGRPRRLWRPSFPSSSQRSLWLRFSAQASVQLRHQ